LLALNLLKIQKFTTIFPCFFTGMLCFLSICLRNPLMKKKTEEARNVVIKELNATLLFRARICEPSKEPRNRFPAWQAGMTTLFGVHRPATLHRLAESIPWNRFLGTLKFFKFGLCLSHVHIFNDETSLLLSSMTIYSKLPRVDVSPCGYVTVTFIFKIGGS
jgi:hypothetical protein